MFALLRTPDSTRYGQIVSRHHTPEEARTAYDKKCSAVLRQCPDAITHLMYEVCELPTPAGDDGEVGDRVAIDLSRQS